VFTISTTEGTEMTMISQFGKSHDHKYYKLWRHFAHDDLEYTVYLKCKYNGMAKETKLVVMEMGDELEFVTGFMYSKRIETVMEHEEDLTAQEAREQVWKMCRPAFYWGAAGYRVNEAMFQEMSDEWSAITTMLNLEYTD
jgi:hypothetical protein